MTTCQQRVLFLGPKGGRYTDLTELPKEKRPKHFDLTRHRYKRLTQLTYLVRENKV